MKKSHHFWLSAWYGKSRWIYLLLPLSWLFGLISSLRKLLIIRFAQKKLSVPLIVVGNISVGGTGKTPLIIALVQYLREQGLRPGVVSRGYGGSAPVYPYLLTESSTAKECGDEPLLIYQSANCAVCVAPDRVAAAEKLIAAGCNILLSDDGLQHYRLGRALEIAVVDGQRLFGNQQLLPVGPLREKPSRLKSVDMVVVNNPCKNFSLNVREFFTLHLKPNAWRHIAINKSLTLDELEAKSPMHAVAGIGNPERFFSTLDAMSLNYYAHAYDDHHQFTPEDFAGFNNELVVMTEKDAVKCTGFAKENWYALVVHAQLNKHFWQALQKKLDALTLKY